MGGRGIGRHRGVGGVWEEGCGGGVDEGADDIGGADGWGLQRLVVVQHPAGENGFTAFLDPLIDEGGDLGSQVGCVIQSGEFKTLQRGTRCGL